MRISLILPVSTNDISEINGSCLFVVISFLVGLAVGQLTSPIVLQ
jgi:hypothetical protein